MGDQESITSGDVDLKFGMLDEKISNGRERPRSAALSRGILGKHGKNVDHAVLDEHIATGGNQVGISFHLGRHMGLAMVAVKNHYHWSPGFNDFRPNRVEDRRGGRISDQIFDTRMGKVVEFLDIDRDDPPVPHQIKQLREEIGRPTSVGTGLDEEGRANFRNRLLDRPEVQYVLPDRLAEPLR